MASRDLILHENRKQGTTDWLLTNLEPTVGTSLDEICRRRPAIEAYGSHMSLRAGQTLHVYVSTDPASSFTAEIFRMGYYDGAGGRSVRTLGPLQGETQPTPEDGPRHRIECHWDESFAITIPSDWLSGVYLGKLTALASRYETYFIFIVRDDRPVDFLFQ